MSRFDHLPAPATALVVGASGGIGAALARALEVEERFRVIRAARHPERCESEALALDLEDDDSIDTFADALRRRTDRLDLVLVASGLLHDDQRDIHPEKRLQDLRRDALERHFSINAIGPLLLARALAPLLPRRDPCIWGNLSARVGSIEDNRAGGWYGYRGSKAAQNMFTRTLAIELGRRHRGLACVALHPGTVATGLSAPFRRAEDDGVRSPDDAADHLLTVIAGLDAGDSGRFLAWDGRGIPW